MKAKIKLKCDDLLVIYDLIDALMSQKERHGKILLKLTPDELKALDRLQHAIEHAK